MRPCEAVTPDPMVNNRPHSLDHSSFHTPVPPSTHRPPERGFNRRGRCRGSKTGTWARRWLSLSEPSRGCQPHSGQASGPCGGVRFPPRFEGKSTSKLGSLKEAACSQAQCPN